MNHEKPRKVKLFDTKTEEVIINGEKVKRFKHGEFVEIGTGFFHGFCTESDGDGMTCHAIIETPDGKVDTWWLKKIQFVEPLK